MKHKIKQYCVESVSIKITDFKLQDVSFYGCDALFEFEIRDDETGLLLDTGFETIENAFMGIDDSEDLYAFLEDKGIDFSEEYDDDFDRLPDELTKDFEEYVLKLYDDHYHEYFFDGDDSTQEEMIYKIKDKHNLDDSLIYVIKGEEIGWIMMSSDYYGVHLKSDDVEIHKVYHVDMQKWIYEVEGEYFDIISDFGPKPDYYITFYKQNEVKQNEEI